MMDHKKTEVKNQKPATPKPTTHEKDAPKKDSDHVKKS